jgi:hypothetical protein
VVVQGSLTSEPLTDMAISRQATKHHAGSRVIPVRHTDLPAVQSLALRFSARGRTAKSSATEPALRVGDHRFADIAFASGSLDLSGLHFAPIGADRHRSGSGDCFPQAGADVGQHKDLTRTQPNDLAGADIIHEPDVRRISGEALDQRDTNRIGGSGRCNCHCRSNDKCCKPGLTHLAGREPRYCTGARHDQI